MRRLFPLVLVSSIFFAPLSVVAADEDSDAESEEEVLSSELPGGCPVLCSPYEACIEQRCVEMCRTGCRPGTFCTAAGECEPLPEPKEAILTEADRQRLSGAESADKTALVFADLGGIVGFGVNLGLEFGQADSFLTRFRALNTGVMSHAVFTENEFQRFEWGFGGSVAYRHYSASWGNLRGFYYGGGLDYSVIRVTDRVSSRVNQMLHSVAPFGEFGYRWVFGNFAVGFGPTIGLRYPIGTGFSDGNEVRCSDGEETSVDSTCEDANSRRFEGVMHFEVGWFQ